MASVETSARRSSGRMVASPGIDGAKYDVNLRALARRSVLVPAITIHGARWDLPSLDLTQALEETADRTVDRSQPRDVRRDDHPPVVPERRGCWQRFDSEDIERSARQPAFLQGFREDRLINHRAPPGVDQD